MKNPLVEFKEETDKSRYAVTTDRPGQVDFALVAYAEALVVSQARVKELEREWDEARPVLEAARNLARVWTPGNWESLTVEEDGAAAHLVVEIRDYDAARAAAKGKEQP